MERHTHRKVIATIIMVAMMVTLVATGQARAQERDYSTERVIAGIVGLAVLGAIFGDELKSSHRERDRERYRTDSYRHDRYRPEPHRRDGGYFDGRDRFRDYDGYRRDDPRRYDNGYIHRGKPGRTYRVAGLPEGCLEKVRTARGDVALFGRTCMLRHYRDVRALPDYCARRVHTSRGLFHGWSPSCLRHEGFRVARR